MFKLNVSLNRKEGQLNEMFTQGLPELFRPAMEYLLTGKSDKETKRVVAQIEAIRGDIARQGDKTVPIWYSPRPGSSGHEVTEDLKPQPGDVLEFTMAQLAKTGKDKRWGTFMHLLAKAAQARRIFELGACVGISGCYLASTGFVQRFITVEGSGALAQLAGASIHQVYPEGQVVNTLFDEAIKNILPTLHEKFDLVFIDGHHEKIATIHYYEKLKPFLADNALVVFDDICWSQDMREAWEVLSAKPDFSHSLDLGVLGVCLYNPGGESRYWDLQPIVGKTPIGKPQGWR
ncbi:MAG: class I SAM-dependent methyltransferase [Hymenobacteraceae bacterium]|nr:class I SAM-dependent methyltransferase [Hymenobacteraceae bacterium]MDX5482433.1 class I SAM-dependent methyltransferase [Hymenobacteraceae bacterium]